MTRKDIHIVKLEILGNSKGYLGIFQTRLIQLMGSLSFRLLAIRIHGNEMAGQLEKKKAETLSIDSQPFRCFPKSLQSKALRIGNIKRKSRPGKELSETGEKILIYI
ncbi:hypothetical protein HHI36_014460 [Cryptolaemus montrouzieri]|uniref:Uncharacterized protein n=1 Tax=Cryptolaemus montrouzieri TaxID=559131 RepID=A0ABD2N3V1_9CUCU